jgi:hypothetical protein
MTSEVTERVNGKLLTSTAKSGYTYMDFKSLMGSSDRRMGTIPSDNFDIMLMNEFNQ